MTQAAPLKIFVGFDSRQPVSFVVTMTSLMRWSYNRPIEVCPLIINSLPIENVGLTPFTFTRFLVPWLTGYSGRAMFVDTDVLFRANPAELFETTRFWYDVNGRSNAVAIADLPEEYQFEAPAVMLFNCEHEDNRRLTPESVETRKTTLVDWTTAIGKFPEEWHHLVGYRPVEKDDEGKPTAKLVHFTQGVPVFPETQGSDFADEWQLTLKLANTTLPWIDLMGPSVHAKTLPDGRKVAKLFQEEQPVARTEIAPGSTGGDAPQPS